MLTNVNDNPYLSIHKLPLAHSEIVSDLVFTSLQDEYCKESETLKNVWKFLFLF